MNTNINIMNNNNESKFIPCYNKYGRWYFLPSSLTMEECNWWFKRENVGVYGDRITQTTILPYNCSVCPKWMTSLYAKYKLLSSNIPREKKEF